VTVLGVLAGPQQPVEKTTSLLTSLWKREGPIAVLVLQVGALEYLIRQLSVVFHLDQLEL
jgi:hypothetical protein